MHILENSQKELKYTQELLRENRTSSLKNKFLSFFGKDFSTYIRKYALKKETILMQYSSLYSDMRKDIKDDNLSPTHNIDVKKSMVYMTESIELCGELLSQWNSQEKDESNIIKKEKIFFTQLLESFHGDIQDWLQNHKQELFEKSQEYDTIRNNTYMGSKSLIELQKKRLETLIDSIPKVK